MRLLTRRPAVTFVLLAFSLTWSAWLPLVMHPDRFRYLHFVGSLGPAVAAVVMTTALGGTAGLHSLGSRAIRCRGPWLGLAVGLPVALWGVGIAVSSVAGDRPELDRLFDSPEYGYVGPALVALAIVFYGFGEELGWRGFLIPLLESRGRTPYAATTMFIGVWASWHIPLFFYDQGLGDMPPLMIPGWLVSIALSSYLITWLFHESGESLLVVAVFHGVVDLVSITPASTVLALVTLNAGLIAAAILTITRSKVLFRTATAASAS